MSTRAYCSIPETNGSPFLARIWPVYIPKVRANICCKYNNIQYINWLKFFSPLTYHRRSTCGWDGIGQNDICVSIDIDQSSEAPPYSSWPRWCISLPFKGYSGNVHISLLYAISYISDYNYNNNNLKTNKQILAPSHLCKEWQRECKKHTKSKITVIGCQHSSLSYCNIVMSLPLKHYMQFCLECHRYTLSPPSVNWVPWAIRISLMLMLFSLASSFSRIRTTSSNVKQQQQFITFLSPPFLPSLQSCLLFK